MKNEDKFIDFREEQPENMQLISLTLLVQNEDKSNDCKEQQLRNIKYLY